MLSQSTHLRRQKRFRPTQNSYNYITLYFNSCFSKHAIYRLCELHEFVALMERYWQGQTEVLKQDAVQVNFVHVEWTGIEPGFLRSVAGDKSPDPCRCTLT
jgi:hypothetical protein